MTDDGVWPVICHLVPEDWIRIDIVESEKHQYRLADPSMGRLGFGPKNDIVPSLVH
jgi:hypothetical protein